MDNIERFKKIKELNRLKAKYHKREFVKTITLENINSTSHKSEADWLLIGKTAFDLFKQIKPITKH